jgi:hypothetical protein
MLDTSLGSIIRLLRDDLESIRARTRRAAIHTVNVNSSVHATPIASNASAATPSITTIKGESDAAFIRNTTVSDDWDDEAVNLTISHRYKHHNEAEGKEEISAPFPSFAAFDSPPPLLEVVNARNAGEENNIGAQSDVKTIHEKSTHAAASTPPISNPTFIATLEPACTSSLSTNTPDNESFTHVSLFASNATAATVVPAFGVDAMNKVPRSVASQPNFISKAGIGTSMREREEKEEKQRKRSKGRKVLGGVKNIARLADKGKKRRREEERQRRGIVEKWAKDVEAHCNENENEDERSVERTRGALISELNTKNSPQVSHSAHSF